jgi:hypothetical protein
MAKTKEVVLVRKPVEVLDVSNEKLLLGIKAKKLLGYKSLIENLEGASSLGLISEVFDKLGIEPFTLKSVRQYQLEKVRDEGDIDDDDEDGEIDLTDYWRETSISYYENPIPEFVLERAIQLREYLGIRADFFIEDFRKDPDPFLVMLYEGLRYYIDVWDEPKFEGRRTK